MLEDQVHLHVRNVLHLVDDGKIIGGPGVWQVLVRQQVHVVKGPLAQIRTVLLENSKSFGSILVEENRLPDTEAEIVFEG